MTSPIDAHVRFDTHPTHPTAVAAVLTGTQAHIALTALEAADWSITATNILVLARIDHEEPYWANETANHLLAEGITVEITPRLQEAIDEEQTWANYPMPWCSRSEVREVSHQAQKIHYDIRHGHLLIHAHAHDAHTTVAVGTYLHRSGKSVYLHGEDHLCQVAHTFDSPAEALTAFEKAHASTMRPGPAPLTDTERAAAEARSLFDGTTTGTEPSRPSLETVPIYLADPGNHETLRNSFLDSNPEFEKRRTWSDETTYAIHESQTLRIEHIHNMDAREIAWTMAACETPVPDRMWHLTATGSTPAPVLQELLNHLADGGGRDTAVGAPVDERTVAAAVRPLTAANWEHASDGHGIRWTAPDGRAGLRFHPLTSRHSQSQAIWTVWSGPTPGVPSWTVAASSHTPSSLLAGLSHTLVRTSKVGVPQPAVRNARSSAAAPSSLLRKAGPPPRMQSR
ncbi:uncharacterized protein DUF317 [Streptomyces sp. KhCrAH-43]|uniref:DUF317 domain-containing protein n=1 Tax=unclassified Streptomyces TaxID=2593676 RepID=UPI00037884FB|nr:MULTISPECIES: DUF317 domain-containing protein [unclassified Streptomyces]MYS36678.1 DUF317 domain-containing protein [Streptomyces sp. SID4920]MYX69149.1 DUF317 domain-containing protein [Streptomyces sp. SID8373]RAJ62002.1 uncharacterized protein DUF317 [Streptomyces sp. KhCrAH-43]